MRIGMFCDMYKPHTSGITNHIALYKRRFEDLGYEVFVFTFGDLVFDDGERNVIRSPGVPWGDTGWRFAPDHSAEAKRVAETLDVAHVHHPFQSGRIARRVCGRLGIPLVYTNHTRYDLYADVYARFVPRSARLSYLRGALRAAYSGASLVVAPSAGIVQWLRDFDVTDEAKLFPNGIDVGPFAHPGSPVPRAELGFTSDDVVFCYVGRLGEEKNTPLLAEAFARAAAGASEARLLVVGDGPARPDAESVLAGHGLADRAVFTGLVPYERIPDYEAAADVFVTASVSEVHPLVVLEAMAAGLPTVAIESPGITDTVEDGRTGLLAPQADADALAERIGRLARDSALRERMSGDARRAAEDYDLPRTADRLLGEYERLAVEARTR